MIQGECDTWTPSWLLLLLVKFRETSAMLRLLLRSYSSCSMVSRITRRITVSCSHVYTADVFYPQQASQVRLTAG